MGEADRKTSNALLIGVGVGLITAVTGLACAGTYSAINAMNRQSEEAIAAAQAIANGQNGTGGETVDVPEQTPPSEDVSDQIKWMQENGITYNEYGLPVDKDGNLVDDPTTEIYDPSRADYFYNEDGTPKDLSGNDDTEPSDETTEPSDEGNTDMPGNEPVTPPDVDVPGQVTETEPATSGWWLDANGNLKDGLQLDENGQPYYVVKSGDWLIRIGERYGFDYQDLARESGIANPSLIMPGQIIRFPAQTTGHVSNSQAPGRG